MAETNNKQEAEADKSEDFTIYHNKDIYNAVLIAAFGGVQIIFPRVKTQAGQVAEKQSIRVHPLFVFVFCFFLFIVQMSCLFCLILDMDLTTPWIDWDNIDEHPRIQMLFLVKCLTIVMVQLISLREAVGALRPLLFVMNPCTWIEMYRPGMHDSFFANLEYRWLFTWIFKSKFVWPICFFAQLFQLIVAYVVFVMSISLILRADTVSATVFNSLVIVYISDLDEYMWSAVVEIFHIDRQSFNGFKFYAVDLEAMKQERASYTHKKSFGRWLYRGDGGRVDTTETFVVFVLLSVAYIRQIFMFIQAFDSGKIPMVRDICDLYRGLNGADIFGHAGVLVADFFTAIDYRATLAYTIHKAGLEEDCLNNEDFKSMAPGDYITYLTQPIIGVRIVLSTFVVILLFLVPQIMFMNHVKVLKCLGNDVSDLIEDEDMSAQDRATAWNYMPLTSDKQSERLASEGASGA